eukprot:maker-scaffold526_size146413-snap-gene-0.23 protein:Tk11267 transcript:maker-scaffold526_size146413-snap-gene-0.23-mRNA-1 annotation:"---NA---"
MFLAWTPTALIMVFFLALTWMPLLSWSKEMPTCRDGAGDVIAKTYWIRMMLFLFIVILIGTCVIVVMIDSQLASATLDLDMADLQLNSSANLANLTFSTTMIAPIDPTPRQYNGQDDNDAAGLGSNSSVQIDLQHPVGHDF